MLMEGSMFRTRRKRRAIADSITTVVEGRLRKYMKQAEVLRQIHSDKAFQAERASRLYTIFTVVTSAVLTLIGLGGITQVAEVLKPALSIDPRILQGGLDAAILLTVFVALAGLVYRFDERAANHHRSIERLTEFIRDTQDRAELAGAGLAPLTIRDLDLYRERYKGIAATLPPSTDKEYIQSKARYAQKKAAARAADATG